MLEMKDDLKEVLMWPLLLLLPSINSTNVVLLNKVYILNKVCKLLEKFLKGCDKEEVVLHVGHNLKKSRLVGCASVSRHPGTQQ